jgi:hypothetical protein
MSIKILIPRIVQIGGHLEIPMSSVSIDGLHGNGDHGLGGNPVIGTFESLFPPSFQLFTRFR